MRVITEDGKEVQDVPGYVETYVTLGEHELKGVRMLVFKRVTNPCLIGRDVLAVHPSTKDHYQAMMGETRPNKLPLKQNHNIDNNNNEEAESTSIECKDNNNNRLPYKTKIENSIERRCTTKSSIESTYDCSRDHQCTASAQQINAIDYPTTPASSPSEEIILIRAIDVVVEETNEALNESINKYEASTPIQASCFATPESQKSQSEPTSSGSISSLMAKLKISSKRLRVLRSRSPYGRKLRFEKQDRSHNELSSSLLDEKFTISEDTEVITASDQTQEQTENNYEESNRDDASILSNGRILEATSIIDQTTNRELPLSESSVVEEPIISDQALTEKELPLSESSMVEEKHKGSSIKNVVSSGQNGPRF